MGVTESVTVECECDDNEIEGGMAIEAEQNARATATRMIYTNGKSKSLLSYIFDPETEEKEVKIAMGM